MITCDAEKAFGSLIEDIQAKMDESNGRISVYTSPSKMPIVNQFALLFFSAFLSIIDEFKLSRNDIRVILKIIELMQFGNLVKLSWSSLGESLGITKNNMVRHIKTLKEASILIEDDGNIFLNPQIIAKGKFLPSKADEDMVRLLDLGAEALKNTKAEPSILTPTIKKEMRERALEKKKINQIDEDMGLTPIRPEKKKKNKI